MSDVQETRDDYTYELDMSYFRVYRYLLTRRRLWKVCKVLMRNCQEFQRKAKKLERKHNLNSSRDTFQLLEKQRKALKVNIEQLWKADDDLSRKRKNMMDKIKFLTKNRKALSDKELSLEQQVEDFNTDKFNIETKLWQNKCLKDNKTILLKEMRARHNLRFHTIRELNNIVKDIKDHDGEMEYLQELSSEYYLERQRTMKKITHCGQQVKTLTNQLLRAKRVPNPGTEKENLAKAKALKNKSENCKKSADKFVRQLHILQETKLDLHEGYSKIKGSLSKKQQDIFSWKVTDKDDGTNLGAVRPDSLGNNNNFSQHLHNQTAPWWKVTQRRECLDRVCGISDWAVEPCDANKKPRSPHTNWLMFDKDNSRIGRFVSGELVTTDVGNIFVD